MSCCDFTALCRFKVGFWNYQHVVVAIDIIFGLMFNPNSIRIRTDPNKKNPIRIRSDPIIFQNVNPKPIRSEKFCKIQSESDPIRKITDRIGSDRIFYGSDWLFLTFSWRCDKIAMNQIAQYNVLFKGCDTHLRSHNHSYML